MGAFPTSLFPAHRLLMTIDFSFTTCISIASAKALLEEGPLEGLVGFTKKLFNSLQ